MEIDEDHGTSVEKCDAEGDESFVLENHAEQEGITSDERNQVDVEEHSHENDESLD